MASHDLSVLLGEVGDDVPVREGEGSLIRLSGVPLLSVGWGELAKVVRRRSDLDIGRIVELAVVGAGAEVRFPSSLGKLVQLCRSCGGGESQTCDGGDTHFE